MTVFLRLGVPLSAGLGVCQTSLMHTCSQLSSSYASENDFHMRKKHDGEVGRIIDICQGSFALSPLIAIFTSEVRHVL